MTKDKIKQNAPDGAMFYAVDGDDIWYLKAISGVWFLWVVDSWDKIDTMYVASIRDDLRQIN